ncbi:MAG: GNAT family N-acetyltransferase [Myxococcota bacterium]
MADLQVRPMGAEPRTLEEDLEQFAACFRDNGDPKDLRHLRWQYADNPVVRGAIAAAEAGRADGITRAGGVFTDFAVATNGVERLGAIYATFPVEMQVGPHRVVGVQSLDTLTDQHHRGQGLFTKLASAVYQRCRQSGVALVYGFPNASSAPGFFGKLGWTRLDPVPFLILPLRSRYFLRQAGLKSRRALKLVPDRLPRRHRPPMAAADEEVTVALALDPAVDGLWEVFADHVRTAVVRDRRYLGGA